MRNDNIKAVVIGGWMIDGSEHMTHLIGAYESPTEAYGAAYLYLDEMAAGYDNPESYSITLPQQMEGDAGYAVYLQSEDGHISDYAYVLINSNAKGGGANDSTDE